jgi:acyl-CoA thioesterase FadM
MTMVESYESVVSRVPFVIRRRVRWADCDPAGVVYTGKFVEYMLGAANLFYANLTELNYRDFLKSVGVDTPCRGLDMDFRGALWPDDEFLLQVSVAALRQSSFDLRVRAWQASGREIFVGRFTPICIPKNGERKSVPIPPAYREALAQHLLQDTP